MHLCIEVSINLRINILELFGHSASVITQVRVDWEARDKKLIPYREHSVKIPYFEEINFYYILSEENLLIDALATFSSRFKVKLRNEATFIHIYHLDEQTHCLAMEAESYDNPCFYDIRRYLERHEYPKKASIIIRKC